jgi:hypothetical protein
MPNYGIFRNKFQVGNCKNGIKINRMPVFIEQASLK